MTRKTESEKNAAGLHNDVDQLASASGKPITVELSGHTFNVAPVKTRQVFPFLKRVRPIFAALSRAPVAAAAGLPPAGPSPGQGGTTNEVQAAMQDIQSGATGLPAHVVNQMQDVDWIMDTMENHGPAVIEALAIALDATMVPETTAILENQINDLPFVETIVLAKHVVVVNAGFFAAQGLTLGNLGAPVVPSKRAKVRA